MNAWRFVFAITLGIAALLIGAANWTAPPQTQSAPHPAFAGMQQSGADAAPDNAKLWIGWSFGALQIALFAAVIALGARSRRGLRGLGLPLIATSFIYLAVWSALVLSYRGQASAEVPTFFLGFPAPTAWMLFALWPCPLIFAAFYVFGFDRWIATPEDIAELEQKLESVRTHANEADDTSGA
jgi:hypothetical protein